MSFGQQETRPQAVGAVLIVEDDQDDAKLLLRELLLTGVRNPIHCLQNAEELFSYLKGADNYQDREKFPNPILLMLDLRMSPSDGFSVLRWLRANSQYANFPVLVVSGVEDQHKVAEAYRLGAKTFIRKPITRIALREALQALNLLPQAKSN